MGLTLTLSFLLLYVNKIKKKNIFTCYTQCLDLFGYLLIHNYIMRRLSMLTNNKKKKLVIHFLFVLI